ncbi:hypothetical protein WICPIJ_003971 [Wickerhamomyces pijperi]|uniref:Transcription factor CBF/NF-Y/archaeal histone domain-containing protein n=1 Tax=Wickerhamomyces pijperi TaxID=599730 RepID=A0A9P8Q8X5_WICPI|nr:hypothetical protein WICPIJ_003971 [Wickerhamomyces pijperi]
MDAIQLTDQQVKEVELREQDRWLPIANVARLMKNTLPNTAKVSKDAKECMQECVSEFISFITSEASDRCLSEKRKTINGEDILFAMSSLGFENYGEVLKIYLAKYREQQALRQERGEIKKSRKQQIQQLQSESEIPSSSSAQDSPSSQTFGLEHPQLDIPDDIMQTIKHEEEELLDLHHGESTNGQQQQIHHHQQIDLTEDILTHSESTQMPIMGPSHAVTNSVQQEPLKHLEEDEIYKYTNDTY